MMELLFVDGISVGDQPTMDSLRRLAFERSGDLVKINCPDEFNIGQLTQVLDQTGMKYIITGTAVSFLLAVDPRHIEGFRFICNGEIQHATAEDYMAFYDKFVPAIPEREPLDFTQKQSSVL